MYEKFKNAEFDDLYFKNPSAAFRGAPFWAWNAQLDKNDLLWQIDRLAEMGFGGFFMHTRCGLEIEYLGKEFMSLIQACAAYAKQKGMFAFLYDEDRWPSGAAGGFVTENKAFRQKSLYLTQKPPAEVAAWGKREERDPKFLFCFDIAFSGDGRLKHFRKIAENEAAKREKWYVYFLLAPKQPWYNGFTYPDTMNENAVKTFIDITHEAYKRAVGSEFGKTVPAIFTDEPNYGWIMGAQYERNIPDVMLPWTDDFAKTFQKAFGYDILPLLPRIVWVTENGDPATPRYHYFRHLTERFAAAYSDQIGSWCKKNGIAFTGHLLNEPMLESQSRNTGEAMRHYLNFDIPGIDILCNRVELSSAKQAQSVAHQCEKEGVLCEMYGVTGWDFDFCGHKFQGDWLAALGVTLRVPHLSWVSMKGSAKRDYPASISFQSAWYGEYPYIENHFARVNTALTRGKPLVKIAVIHPIESYWLAAGDLAHTEKERQRMEEQFDALIQWLLRGCLDFDFVSESLLPVLYKPSKKGFTVGKMTYDAVLIPPVSTLRASTIGALERFLEAGGKVVCAGERPDCADGELSDAADTLYKNAVRCDFTEEGISDALSAEREVEIFNADNGERTKNLICNLRQDGEDRWLFAAHCDAVSRREGALFRPQKTRICLKGNFKPYLYDTLSGNIEEIEFSRKDGFTCIERDVYAYDSLLIRYTPPRSGDEAKPRKKPVYCGTPIRFDDKVKYRLGEPNVLVLDQCEYSLDGRSFAEKEEILRIDSLFRKRFSYPPADGQDVQPWRIEKKDPDRFVYLRFDFESEIAAPCRFAFEEAQTIEFNGENVPVEPDGYFVDKALKSVKLPDMKKGANRLLVRVPISERISIENMFITGDFGVKSEGRSARVIKLPEKIAFGSITQQGFPFYGGAITYELPFESDKKSAVLSADFYCGTTLKAALNKTDAGILALPPYRLPLAPKKGENLLELTLFASRANCFGALHACADFSWKGPNLYYTQGPLWAYEYQLKDVGIMKSPEIYFIKETTGEENDL